MKGISTINEMLVRTLSKLLTNGSVFVRILRSPSLLDAQDRFSAVLHSHHFLNFSMEPSSSSMSEEKKKPKKPAIPKITLLSSGDLMITTLEEAQKLSKRRDLKLVKITDFDAKMQRPIYQLMTSAEYRSEELKQREKRKLDKKTASVKGSKLLSLNSNISEHDLNVKINMVAKWVSKRYEVNVAIARESSSIEKVVSSVL